MKGPLIYIGIPIFLIIVHNCEETEAIYNNICRLFPDNTKLGDPKSCASFITCVNSTEISTKCPTNQIFSVDSKKCVKSKTGCEDPCKPDIDNYWVADSKSCAGYYFCTNGVGVIGNCSAGLHFNETLQECIYSDNSKCKGDNYCQIVPNGINFKDETSCGKYQVCEKNKLKSKKCAAGQWFDRETGKCTSKALVKGCDLLPEKVCMNGRKVEKDKFVSDQATCRGYYFCKDMGKTADEDPQWNQCNEGEFFRYSDQSCANPLTVDCKEDRCDGRGNLFVNSGKDCQHYLVCKDGITVEERKCADERFFDETKQACTAEVIEYDACT